MKIKKILIVGGGSSGWMTAAALVKQLPHMEVHLVESKNFPIIGVGESTLSAFNLYLDALGLKDSDWMPHCNATYKTSIKFTDFREKLDQPTAFHYPFGGMRLDNKPFGMMGWFMARAYDPNIAPHTFAEYVSDVAALTNQNRITHNHGNELNNFDFRYHTAYHFDATQFGQYLKNHICLPAGVQHHLLDVVDIPLTEQGAVKCILTSEGTALTADLYVDCTGFKSLLLEQTLRVPFESFNATLLNDRAIATQIPYIDVEREMESVTNCTAIEAGWVWNIPTWSRMGTGYVYSSRFATPAEAEQQFRAHLHSNRMICPDAARAAEAELRHIEIRHGRHARSWQHNVVAVGLSNGFIEPLESTGLLLTHNAILNLVDILQQKQGTVNAWDQDQYSAAINHEIDGLRQFVEMHYAFSSREDTPYWRAATQHTHHAGHLARMGLDHPDAYARVGRQMHNREFHQDLQGILYIAAGMGVNPVSARYMSMVSQTFPDMQHAAAMYHQTQQQQQQQREQRWQGLSSHWAFLQQHIHTQN